tara:strand:+ start:171 stop:314 length:144 start_codon:yes stop_codon:yes gene_type:complete
MEYKESTKIELLIMKITYLDIQIDIMKKIDCLDEEIRKKEKDEKNEQ